MHDLLQVLSNRDLSRAGDLFSVSDIEILPDLSEVLKQINKIISQSSYLSNMNDQSVIEICIARCLTCIRDSGKAEQFCKELMEILETCLFMGNLQQSSKNADSPHAKISSDLISSIFLNYNSKKSVMEISIPVAVKFLNKGNRELSRNLASYLSLIAIEHAPLLRPYINLILDSILTDNYGLSRILLSLYEVNSEPIVNKSSELIDIIPKCETQEQLSLLQLFARIAKTKPSALHGSLQQLCDLLANPLLTQATLVVLLRISEQRPLLMLDHAEQIKKSTNAQSLSLIAQILTAIGKLGKEHAQVALDYVLEHLPSADRSTHSILLEEARKLCTQYPALFTEKVTAVVRQRNILIQQAAVNGDINKGAGVTIVKLNQTPQLNTKPQVSTTLITAIPTSQNGVPHSYARKNSRSTGRLHSGGGNTRSMTRLNIGSVGGLHKSMTRLSSGTISQQNGASSGMIPTTGTNQPLQEVVKSQNVIIGPVLKSGNVTVTTSPTKQRPYSTGPLGSNSAFYKNFVKLKDDTNLSSNALDQSSGSLNAVSVHHATPASPVSVPIVPIPSDLSGNQVSVSGPSTEVTRRYENKSITLLNAAQRGSVFEPYPMRDTIQHFCEKHLDKIKAYTKKVSACLPPPAKCTVEERRGKKIVKLHFACQQRGPHCLYSKTFFTMKTKNPKTWIHLMFLDLQSRADCALSSFHPSVSSLRHCWDTLKCENKTFITLVTSAFPHYPKETDTLLYELRNSGFFDVFELGPATPEEVESMDYFYKWGCFLCNHPEKAMGFMEGNNQPVIEGQLKEKKGKWRLFRRWRTRYFTLNTAQFSCKSGGESIDINQIRSVKVSRGARNIPKAFEIFTGDQTLILKPKDGKNAEEWVQCLSIVVAHSQARDTPPAKTNSLPARSLNRFSTFES